MDFLWIIENQWSEKSPKWTPQRKSSNWMPKWNPNLAIYMSIES